MTPGDRPVVRRAVVAGVGVVALLLRLPGLSRPRVFVFDELYYAPDAADLLRWGAEHGQPAHPQLGKWLIAVGIRVFGFDPVGWRSASVVAGAVICSLVAWAAIVMTGRVAAGVAAGVIAATDGLVHVTSRLALLDVFVALFTTAVVASLIAALQAAPDRRLVRRYVACAVVALAMGSAVKWSAVAFAPLVLAMAWVLLGRVEAPGRPRRRARVSAVVAVVLLPVLVVVAAALPRQLGPDATTPAAWLDEQRDVARFHRELRPTNPNAASAWTWVLQQEPASLWRSECPSESGATATVVDSCPDGPTVRRIVAGSNPVVWLMGIAAFLVALWASLRGDELAGVLVGSVASGWIPWLLSPREAYSFYAVVVVPPLVLGIAWAADRAPGRWRTAATWVPAAVAVVGFVVLWPVWSAQAIDADLHRALTWWPGWG